MLKSADKEKLKSVFKLDADQLIIAAIAAEEMDLDLPLDITVFTAGDLTARDVNMKKAGKMEGERTGESKGTEIIIKRIANKLVLDGHAIGNDIDSLAAAAQSKLSAAGLQLQIDLLKIDKERLASEFNQERNKAEQATLDQSLIGMFPPNRTADLKDSERLLLLKNELSFETVNGSPVASREGNVLTDSRSKAPLPLDRVFNEIFTDRKWINNYREPIYGRGGTNSNLSSRGSIKSLSDFTEKWIAENPGKNDVSPEFDKDLANYIKSYGDFDLDL